MVRQQPKTANPPRHFSMIPSKYQPRDFLWSQRDWRWRNKKLGASQLDCGHYGCASLCLTYIIDRRFKEVGLKFLYPSQVIDRSNYTPGGMIYWNSADIISAGRVKQVWRRADAHYVLMEVKWGNYLHWLVQLNGDLCYDPWENGSACIKYRDQVYWRPTGRYIYYRRG